jgi:hypothetical protein
MAKVIGEFLADVFEVDTASGNGSTTVFSLSGKLHSQDSLGVYVDGLKRRITTDYTVNVGTSQVTFVVAPAQAQNIEFQYIKKSL